MQSVGLEEEPKATNRLCDIILKLQTGGPAEKVDAARRLGESKAKSAVPQLIRALNDKNQHVRSWAAWALGEIKDTRAIDPLVRPLEKHLRLAKTDYAHLETKCINAMYLALESITGKKYGWDIEKWKSYQKEIEHRRHDQGKDE
jgi:HEAT repeat protein